MGVEELLQKLRTLLRDDDKVIWEDEELLCYLDLSLNLWNLYPPETEDTIDQLRPSWSVPVLWGAVVNAVRALQYNWVEGDDIPADRMAKYQELMDSAAGQFLRLTDAKRRTVMLANGLGGN